MLTSDEMKELRPFLDPEGRLTQLPAKRKRLLAACLYLAQKLESGRVYTESELNGLIGLWETFGDAATFRRELVNHRLVERDRYGREYRKPEKEYTLEELLALY